MAKDYIVEEIVRNVSNEGWYNRWQSIDIFYYQDNVLLHTSLCCLSVCKGNEDPLPRQMQRLEFEGGKINCSVPLSLHLAIVNSYSIR